LLFSKGKDKILLKNMKMFTPNQQKQKQQQQHHSSQFASFQMAMISLMLVLLLGIVHAYPTGLSWVPPPLPHYFNKSSLFPPLSEDSANGQDQGQGLLLLKKSDAPQWEDLGWAWGKKRAAPAAAPQWDDLGWSWGKRSAPSAVGGNEADAEEMIERAQQRLKQRSAEVERQQAAMKVNSGPRLSLTINWARQRECNFLNIP
jgi:hypothetical protein